MLPITVTITRAPVHSPYPVFTCLLRAEEQFVARIKFKVGMGYSLGVNQEGDHWICTATLRKDDFLQVVREDGYYSDIRWHENGPTTQAPWLQLEEGDAL